MFKNKLIQKRCNTCFFLQDNECVLSKKRIPTCEMKARKIKGVDNIEFYVNLVNSRNLSVRALYFSISSLLISLSSQFNLRFSLFFYKANNGVPGFAAVPGFSHVYP